MNIQDIKRQNSQVKIEKLKTMFQDSKEIAALDHLTIFVSGSYAREEASEFSDIDLFFIYDGKLCGAKNPRITSLRIFSKVVEISDQLGFPRFSNDGEYLQILEKPKILEDLGGRLDDYQNHFTARMLLILESKCVYGDATYDSVLKSILNAYFKDYPDHPKNFQPTFLVNDIIRFWKTLCLNYENKRNQPNTDPDKKVSQKIKNLKLKYSRMLTCFGSICYIVSLNGNVDAEDIMKMSEYSPLQRLQEATRKFPKLEETVSKAILEYEWFLNLTNVSEEDLMGQFRNKETRATAFSRANDFGDHIFDITRTIAEENNYLRYLLV